MCRSPFYITPQFFSASPFLFGEISLFILVFFTEEKGES